MDTIKKGTIIEFTTRAGTLIRNDLQGCRGEVVKDYTSGEVIHVKMLEGRFKGQTMMGEIKQEDFSLWILNKGK